MREALVRTWSWRHEMMLMWRARDSQDKCELEPRHEAEREKDQEVRLMYAFEKAGDTEARKRTRRLGDTVRGGTPSIH